MTKKKLVYLVSGGGTNMQAVLDAIERKEIDAESLEVISSNCEAYALERAKKMGIPAKVFARADFGGDGKKRDRALCDELKRLMPDYILLVGYLGILSDEIIKEFEYKLVNIHHALLPKFGGSGFYGLNVHRAVLEAGEKVTGATVHFVGDEIDGGLIIRQKSTAVREGDTPESLQKRVLDECEHPLLVGVVRDLCADRIKVKDGKLIEL